MSPIAWSSIWFTFVAHLYEPDWIILSADAACQVHLWYKLGMAKKKMHRDAVLHCRVPAKVKYGADLLCRKHSASTALIVEKSLLTLFDKEGLMARGPGEMTTLLDKLWSPIPEERLYRLWLHAPDLMTQEERELLQWVREMVEEEGQEFNVAAIIAQCEEKRANEESPPAE
jgi:hypothetical protein